MSLRVISSMATRKLLQELIAQFESATSVHVVLESVGGVDAAKRVRAGEVFDIVVLAKDAIENLSVAGLLLWDDQVDIVQSGVAVAVRRGDPHPDITTPDAVKRALLAARTVGYSTGPSGVQLAKLFDTWGIKEALAGRIAVAPPGVPVATLVARGEVTLGFQQLSELLGVDGIDIIGGLPPEIAISTTFSGAIAKTATHDDRARELLQFMATPAVTDIKRRHGMDPT